MLGPLSVVDLLVLSLAAVAIVAVLWYFLGGDNVARTGRSGDA
jgi:hypothetical protein